MNVLSGKETLKKLTVKDFILKYNAFIMLVVLVIVSSLLSDKFLSYLNISNILRQNTPLMIVALGMLIVILTGGIDLSVGSIAGVAGMLLAISVETWKWNNTAGLLISIVFTMAVGFAIGSITGFLVSVVRMAPFVATLAMMTMARGLSFLLSNGQPIRLNPEYSATKILNAFGSENIPIPVIGFPWPILLGIIAVVAFILIIRYTTFGRLVVATGSNETAVRLAGITVEKFKFLAYALSGMLSALAGIVATARTATGQPILGSGLELDGIAACVIGGASLSGGKGTVTNTVIGVVVLGLITNIMNLLSVAAYPQQIIKGAIIIFAVLLQGINERRRNV